MIESEIRINAFYCISGNIYLPFVSRRKCCKYNGCLKLRVKNAVPESNGKFVEHPYYPLIYVPLRVAEGKAPVMDTGKAMLGKAFNPKGYGERNVWELNPLKKSPRASENRKLEVIYEKAEEKLEKLIKRCTPFPAEQISKYRGFMSQFPTMLWEGYISQENVYGSTDNSVRLSVHGADLEDRVTGDEDKVSRESSERKILAPRLIPRPAGQWER